MRGCNMFADTLGWCAEVCFALTGLFSRGFYATPQIPHVRTHRMRRSTRPREVIMKKLLIAITIALWTTAPGLAKPANTDENILHVLDRLSFGPRPGDVEAVHKRGISGYIKD